MQWSGGYPDRQQIVSQITKVWTKYKLEEKTKFDTRVQKVYKDAQGRWIINDPSNGRFDGVIACEFPPEASLPVAGADVGDSRMNMWTHANLD